MSKRHLIIAACFAALAMSRHSVAQDSGLGGRNAVPPSSAQKSAARPPARGPLPDPVLLDGSTQPPEKKPEFGMLGQFEIPGDENARGEKVGGPQRPAGSPPGGGGQPEGKGGGGSMAGLPPMGKSGGGGGENTPESDRPSQGGGKEGAGKGGKDDPNATASGTQVAELKTDEANGPAGAGEPTVEKPKPVAIGDPAMQIKPAPNAPGVIGTTTTAGQTQQMEKAVGGSGKGAPGDNANKGVEKGRVMPAGL